MSSALVFAPAENSVGHSDAGSVFQPEAREYARLHGASLHLFNVSGTTYAQRMAQVLAVIEAASHPITSIAFLSHGWRDGVQEGFWLNDTPRLARAIVGSWPWRSTDCVVALYACSTGTGDGVASVQQGGPGGEGGFADTLAEQLYLLGWRGRLWAHYSAGHATLNPDIAMFTGARAHSGEWVAAPGTPAWRQLQAKLGADQRFRLSFPFLSMGQLRRVIAGAAMPAIARSSEGLSLPLVIGVAAAITGVALLLRRWL